LDLKTLHSPAMPQMFFDNLINIFNISIGIPDALWIYGDYWTPVTAIHAPGSIDPHPALARQAKRLDPVFGIGPRFQGVRILAAGAAIFALVRAKKYVVAIISHIMDVHDYLIWR